jgi:hypothetical protein
MYRLYNSLRNWLIHYTDVVVLGIEDFRGTFVIYYVLGVDCTVYANPLISYSEKGFLLEHRCSHQCEA